MENNEKIENILNLALEVPLEERMKSESLVTGYDNQDNTWELILKYSGSESELQDAFLDALIIFLSNGYAVVKIPQEQIERLAEFPMVEYIEKPKRLYFAVEEGRRASCINQVQRSSGLSGDGANDASSLNLTGKGTLIACIDSGIDYAHPDFRNEDGTTRILWLWDQTLGVEYSREQINEALSQETNEARYAICPSRDISGHGTHVAGIAAGNGRASNGRIRGVAYEAQLIIVKLGSQQENAFPKTTQLMEAIDYSIYKARQALMPIALNISFGNNYGSHTGSSLIETYIDSMATQWKNNIIIGTGNEGTTRIHTGGTLTQRGETQRIQWIIGEFETGTNLQLWKRYEDEIQVTLIAPNGQQLGPFQTDNGSHEYHWENTTIYVYYASPSPYSIFQEIYIELLPVDSYIDSGLWTISLEAQVIVTGAYQMWLPAGGVLNENTGFLNPTEEHTLTIPSTATRAISVGAYNDATNQYASFSGRGFSWWVNRIKPEIVAPGVDIVSCAPDGGYTSRTGTSMATPFVTGSASLLMEWGIVQGNDAYLYGEKLKAYLIKGARKLEGYETYPNVQLGYGALCVRDSLPI